jgi:hypothetical protein
MVPPEYFKSFPRRTHTTFLYILNALPDFLSGICVGGDVKQTLIASASCTTASAFPLIVRTRGFYFLFAGLVFGAS